MKNAFETAQNAVGTLNRWHTQGCYGIIRTTPDAFGRRKDYFVHISNILSGDPVVGSVCNFIVGPPTPGRALLPALQCKFSQTETEVAADIAKAVN